jgi:hypothetical protein
MTKTKYYNLQMDDPQDDYDVDVVNANLKKIDEQMKTRENATDALQEPEFTVAAKRENIASKEKMPKILGKIAKFFADLKTVAFSGKYNDLDGKPAIVNNNTTTEPGSALDARQANPNIEGTMAASIAQINSNLNSEIIAVHVEDPFSGTVYYTIRGGICIVQIWFISCKSGKLISAPIAKNLPYAAMCAGTLGENYAGGTGSGIFMYIDVNTNAICCHKAEDCHEFFGSFCYPVIK